MKVLVSIMLCGAMTVAAQDFAGVGDAFNYGIILKDQKKYSDAAAEFERAINLAENANDAKTQNLRTKAEQQVVNCRILAADSLYKNGYFDDAVTALETAKETAILYKDAANRKLIDEAMPRMVFAQGINLMNNGNNEEALVFLDRSLALNPNQSNVLLSMGVCYMQLGNAEEAIKFYEKAIAAATTRNVPGDAAQARKAATTYLLSTGQDQKDQGLYDEAYKYFEKLTKFDPQNGEGYLQMAIAANHSKKYKNAIEAAQKGIDVEKRVLQTSQLAYQLAYAHELNSTPNREKACEYYRKAQSSTHDATKQNAADAIRRLRCGK